MQQTARDRLERMYKEHSRLDLQGKRVERVSVDSDLRADLQVKNHGAEGIPKPILAILEIMALVMLGLVIAYGHPFYVCNRMKDNGEFFYGMTIGSCVRQKASQNLNSAQSFVGTLFAR